MVRGSFQAAEESPDSTGQGAAERQVGVTLQIGPQKTNRQSAHLFRCGHGGKGEKVG